MAKHTDFSYYEALRKLAEYAQEAALNLESGTRGGELGSRELMMALHTIENDADFVNQQIQARLLSDFAVPFPHDGMSVLAHALDDVTDSVEQVAIDAYVLAIAEAPEGCDAMLEMLSGAVENLLACTVELARQPKAHDAIVRLCHEVGSLESQCDTAYIEAARKVSVDPGLDSRQRYARHGVLSAIEAAMDAAKEASLRTESLLA